MEEVSVFYNLHVTKTKLTVLKIKSERGVKKRKKKRKKRSRRDAEELQLLPHNHTWDQELDD